MTPEQEQQVLATLYTRLYDAITFSPSTGQPGAFTKATTFLQFSKHEALNPADFAGAASPINPAGDFRSAETFSRMVDTVPALQADYAPTQNHVSDVYRTIVEGANAVGEVDPQQLERYEKAYHYLNQVTTVTDFEGNEVKTAGPSPIYKAYQNNHTAYIAAVSAYRTAWLGYDLDDLVQQRQWQANEPVLRNAVTQAYQTWRDQGVAQVEQARAALASSVNSAVRNAIADAREAVSEMYRNAPSVQTNPPWLMSYALPSNWADESAEGFSSLTIDSSNLAKEADSNFSSYGGGGSWGAGLWSVGASAEVGTGSTHAHTDAQNIRLTAKIGIVRIFRPWLHEFLFRMQGWYLEGRNEHGISNGQLAGNAGNMLPLIPTAFIVARDIEIQGDFSTEDQSHVETSISTSANVGWGPFGVSGSYSHSQSNDKFQATFAGGTLRIPGMQIIAWVSEIVPASPQMNPPEA